MDTAELRLKFLGEGLNENDYPLVAAKLLRAIEFEQSKKTDDATHTTDDFSDDDEEI